MNQDVFSKAIIPSIEIGSYEALWMEENISFNKIAAKFKYNDDILKQVFPSDFINNKIMAAKNFDKIMNLISKSHLKNFGFRFRDTLDYPDKLNAAKAPLQVLYYAGNWQLANSPSVSIVGTRHPTPEGLLRTKKLVKELVKQGFTIISGLAAGIDTQAHTTAIEEGGKTIAVIGTPLNVVYPKENKELYNKIVENHLAISQVPFLRYEKQSYDSKRFYFPERNKTMSALSDATIIVEAGETSGTLIQARAALEQVRPLFILASCFDKGLTWPEKYLAKGAIKVNNFDDIWNVLGHSK